MQLLEQIAIGLTENITGTVLRSIMSSGGNKRNYGTILKQHKSEVETLFGKLSRNIYNEPEDGKMYNKFMSDMEKSIEKESALVVKLGNIKSPESVEKIIKSQGFKERFKEQNGTSFCYTYYFKNVSNSTLNIVFQYEKDLGGILKHGYLIITSKR